MKIIGKLISHFPNEQGTENEYLKPIGSKNQPSRRKEHSNISTFT